MGIMTDYSDEERDTIRSAAFGATLLVSKADPGFFSTFKESLAASRALAGASPELREVLAGGLPRPPVGGPEEVDRSVLTNVRHAVEILQEKGPDEVEGFRTLVVDACDKVAEASGGVTSAETEAIDRVKEALGVG